MNDLMHQIVNVGYSEVEQALATLKANYHRYAKEAAMEHVRKAKDLLIQAQQYDEAVALRDIERKLDPPVPSVDDLGVPGAEPPVGLSAVSPRGGEDAAPIPHAHPGGTNSSLPEP